MKYETMPFAATWMDLGTSLAVQWLRLCTPTSGGVGLIPGRGTKISHVAWHDRKEKEKEKEKEKKKKKKKRSGDKNR